MSAPDSDSTIDVLLWSVRGSGEHYNGPGSFSYRLYTAGGKKDDRFSLTLAHGTREQESDDLFNSHHFMGEFLGAKNLFRFLYRSKRWLRANAHRFDIMHVLSGFHASVSPAYYAHRLGLPAILFVACHKEEFCDKPGIQSIFQLPAKRRRMICELEGIVAMSRDIYQEVRGHGVAEKNIARIPMGVNLNRFHPVEENQKRELRELLGLADRRTIVFTGSVVPGKRPDMLARAVGEANDRGTDCQLLIIGPTSREPEFSRQLADLIDTESLDKHVHLIPFTPEVEKYYQAADLFCLPSEHEGMPAAMVEAMACGIPPIGTRISGVRDLITEDSNGTIVDATPSSIADAICGYLESDALRFEHGSAARQTAEERYGAQAVLDAYLQLFKIVLQGGDPCEASILPEME